DGDDPGEYGWGAFRLVSTEHKLRYLAAQLFKHTFSEKDRDRLVAKFAPYVPNIEEITPKSGEDSYSGNYFSVDHQSQLMVPKKWNESFADALIAVFLSPNVVVMGGNDNTDYTGHHVAGQTPSEFVRALSDRYGTRMRTDSDFVTLFDSFRGTKMRMSLGETTAEYTKAQSPELVDLKITDYCGSNCRFCYQGSTENGLHAPFERIVEIIDMLGRLDVFEVAIGGGEPTDHPQFGEILAHAERRGVKPNFTTLSGRWLQSPETVNAVLNNVGAIGVSCSSVKGLELVREIKAAMTGWHAPRVMAQHVMGSVPLTVTSDFLTQAFAEKIPVLLLGYKDVGFGATYARHDVGDVPFFLRMAVQNVKDPSLSVDTALVDQYPTLTEQLGAPKALVTSPEGKFSCYIDAVTERMAASSYGPLDGTTELPRTDEEFLSVFATY
ncbi:MAG: radical SAM protein, partial [Verrucomicrobiaceae bacterium]